MASAALLAPYMVIAPPIMKGIMGRQKGVGYFRSPNKGISKCPLVVVVVVLMVVVGMVWRGSGIHMDRRVSSNHLFSLQGSVSSLRASCATMASSIAALDAGVYDFPRMTRILKANRHFEVMGESEVLDAHQALQSEIQPHVNELLKKAEAQVAKLDRKEKGLASKSDLQQVRLQQRPQSKPAPTDRLDASTLEENAERMRALRKKRERLEYMLQRLELESGQKQHREARANMSMA